MPTNAEKLNENLTEIKAQTDALLAYANSQTGKDDPDLGEAIRSLVDSMGSGEITSSNVIFLDECEVVAESAIVNTGNPNGYTVSSGYASAKVIKLDNVKAKDVIVMPGYNGNANSMFASVNGGIVTSVSSMVGMQQRDNYSWYIWYLIATEDLGTVYVTFRPDYNESKFRGFKVSTDTSGSAPDNKYVVHFGLREEVKLSDIVDTIPQVTMSSQTIAPAMSRDLDIGEAIYLSEYDLVMIASSSVYLEYTEDMDGIAHSEGYKHVVVKNCKFDVARREFYIDDPPSYSITGSVLVQIAANYTFHITYANGDKGTTATMNGISAQLNNITAYINANTSSTANITTIKAIGYASVNLRGNTTYMTQEILDKLDWDKSKIVYEVYLLKRPRKDRISGIEEVNLDIYNLTPIDIERFAN